MKYKIWLLILIAVYSYSQGINAQNSFSIGSNTHLVTSGNVSINYNGGTLTNNGTLAGNEGTLVFSAPVVYSGTGTAFVKNLEINHAGTSQVNNLIQVIEALRVNNGSLNANDHLTLISNASGSAVIDPVASGSSIVGKVTVQRYIPLGKRAFRFLTPGVTTDDFISNNWQLATHITGSTTGANGFDQTASGNPSMFTYNNQQASGSGWTAIANTNDTNLQVGYGYRVLIRGDRTPSNITAASQPDMNAPITLSATGTVAVGQIVFNASSTPAINNTNNTSTNGFSLIGNPYVNSVNWNNLSKTGLIDAYYTWDPNMGTVAQRGRFVVFSSTTGTNNIVSDVNEYIQPGQAFLVKNEVAATAGSITFQETDKTGIVNVQNLNRSATMPQTRLDLQIFETNELALGNYPIDAAVTVFDDQFSNAIETGDVTKLSTGVENISILNNNIRLTIDARPHVDETDEILIQLQQFQANKAYTFRPIFNNFNPNLTPFLFDHYLNQYTVLGINNPTDVAFTTSSEATSFDINRFKIVFQNTPLSNPLFDENEVLLYPNPVTNSVFNLQLPKSMTDNVNIKISNLLGQDLFQAIFLVQPTVEVKINQQLPEGVYHVHIENLGNTTTHKIIIKK